MGCTKSTAAGVNPNVTKDKIVVQGATGNTGGACLSALFGLFPDKKVVAATRDPAAHGAKLREMHANCEVRQLDASKPDTVAAVLRDCDTLLVIPPNIERRGEEAAALIGQAKVHGVKHIVLLSVSDADKGQILIHKQFQVAHAALRASDVPFTIVECEFFQENFIGFAEAIKTTHKLFLHLGTGAFAPVSVSDIGACLASIAANPEAHKGKVYNLTGPRKYTGPEVAATFAEVLGAEFEYVPTDEASTLQAFQSLGFPDWQARAVVELFAVRYQADITSATQDVKLITGKEARSLKDTITGLKAAFQ